MFRRRSAGKKRSGEAQRKSRLISRRAAQMAKPKKPEEVFRILRRHDRNFAFPENRAKGSERMIYHPNINGRSESFPMTFHRGRDVRAGMLKAIIRRFSLPNNIFG
jgi:predicted RNA binding protein YcfA (HicA-like mRNA interferase family)